VTPKNNPNQPTVRLRLDRHWGGMVPVPGTPGIAPRHEWHGRASDLLLEMELDRWYTTTELYKMCGPMGRGGGSQEGRYAVIQSLSQRHGVRVTTDAQRRKLMMRTV